MKKVLFDIFNVGCFPDGPKWLATTTLGEPFFYSKIDFNKNITSTGEHCAPAKSAWIAGVQIQSGSKRHRR